MTLSLADPAPHFALPGIDGREHTLESYADAAVLVLVQSCNHCPYVLAWEGRLNAIARDYAEHGVDVVALNANDASRYPADSFERMVEHAAAEGFVFDYLHDETQSVARALGAERTPEVFVFDRERRLRYHGAIDDSRDDQAVTTHYLRDTLDAVLAGEIPAVSETPAVGCSVKWLE
ncbi:MAG: thioredoxin family protein [Actinomycetes bacterium]